MVLQLGCCCCYYFMQLCILLLLLLLLPVYAAIHYTAAVAR